MKLYNSFLNNDISEAKRIQFKMLELIETMFAAGNFPEGFREGVNLRGFNMGRARQAMSPSEMDHFNNISDKLACLLTECGYSEASSKCSQLTHTYSRQDVEGIVRNVIASSDKVSTRI